MEKLVEAIFEQAFNEMPDEFTSKHFCTVCRKYGLKEQIIKNGDTRKYLENVCARSMDSRRSWFKVHNLQEKFLQMQLDLETKEEKIQNAIALLKNEGYKVLKSETTFKEI